MPGKLKFLTKYCNVENAPFVLGLLLRRCCMSGPWNIKTFQLSRKFRMSPGCGCFSGLQRCTQYPRCTADHCKRNEFDSWLLSLSGTFWPSLTVTFSLFTRRSPNAS